ncbi:MAG: hypothetical protein PHQ65_11840 [Bacteroidales bacterium]|nr:hypothetical protein [Bacteroidales bacterium]MDD3665949.1 hypothetical protein [Bacteroidales bacterium]
MKEMIKSVVVILAITLSVAFSQAVFAQAPPAPPAAGAAGGGTPMGGGAAPIGGGIAILLALGAGYGYKKVMNANNQTK